MSAIGKDPAAMMNESGSGGILQSMNKLVYVLAAIGIVIWLLADVFGVGNVSGNWVFLTRRNISNVLNQVSINTVIAFGMTLVILTKGIDLSVGSVVAFTGVFLSILFVDAKLPLWLCYILTMMAGAAAGIFNGALIACFRLPPFIATLGSLVIFRGLAFLLVDGRAKFISDKTFRIVGNGFLDLHLFPVPWSVLIMLGFFIVFHFMMSQTTFGRKVYFLGGNEEAARLVGIKPRQTRMAIFGIMGLMVGVSSIMVASRLGSGSPNIGTGYEMDAIAAVVVGGTSFAGGKGTIIGTLLGAVTIGLIANGMNLMGISPYFQYLAKGVIILLAVILSSDYKSFGGKRK